MKNMSGKIVAWLNDGARDYVYGPRRWFSPLRIVFCRNGCVCGFPRG